MRMRVATLNVWGLPEPIAPVVPARMREIGRQLAALDVDVVAFQEVWTPEASAMLRRAADRAGLVHVWSGASALEGGGLLIASRLPIEEAHFESFALRGQAEHVANLEYLSGKGFVRVTLGTEAGPVTLINTHLHARYSKKVPHAFAPHRVGQIVQLAQQARAATGPTVVLGDFNVREEAPEYEVLTSLMGVRDAAVETDRRLPTVVAGSPFRPHRRSSRRKDYVFVRDGAERGVAVRSLDLAFDETFERAGRELACSNHYGVVVDLEIGAASGAPGAPCPKMVDLASKWLEEGRLEAEQRQRGDRKLSSVGAGVGVAALAVASMSDEPMSRRSFLRRSLRSTALVALAPAAGYTLLSEVFVPDEIHAFRDASARLEQLAARTDADGTLPS